MSSRFVDHLQYDSGKERQENIITYSANYLTNNVRLIKIHLAEFFI